MKKRTSKLLALLLAMVMLLSAVPLTAFAAPASDIPAEMLDNDFLDALAYTGYNVQAQKDDGTIYKKFGGAMNGSPVLSGIKYDTSFGTKGTETVADSSTVSGKAPDIALFRRTGMCCAAYTSYVYYNYLPNIAGVDVSKMPRPANLVSAPSWRAAADSWVANGNARNISFTVSADGSNFKPSEDIPIGSLFFFRGVGSTTGTAHVAIYAGYYNGNHFLTHVGNDRGPEFVTVNGMTKGGEPEVVSQVVVPDIFEEFGTIKVIKKDPNGKSLSGAIFVATSTTDSSKKFIIGPTDNNGYAVAYEIPYGTYTVKETVFPKNYTSSGQSSWTVTVDSKNDGVVTINAVNQLKKGYIEVVKSDAENGANLAGAEFTVYDSGNKEVTKIGPTDSKGYAKSSDIPYGSYTVKETKFPPNYQAGSQTSWNVTLSDDSPKIKLDIANARQYGSLKVTKTAEDGIKEGFTFALTGTSVYGEAVNMTATTGADGTATFNNVPVGSGYVLSEQDTPLRYVVPDDQTAAVEWNKVTNKSFENILKKWNATVTKEDWETDGVPQGDATLEGAVYGVYDDDELVDTYTTDANGQFTTKYYVCGARWKIKEISPSNGYQLNPTVYPVGAHAYKYTIEYNSLTVDVNEDVMKGSVAIIKHADNGSTQVETPEVGAEFQIYLKTAGSYAAAKPAERDTLVCDKDGLAESKQLPFGVYVVHQTKGWEGYEMCADFEVDISENGATYRYILNNRLFESYVKVIKTDAETGKTIAYSGAGFQIYNPAGELVTMHVTYPTDMVIDTFYTDTNGQLITPQQLPYGKGYKLVEVKAPHGYVLDGTPIPFDITKEESDNVGNITVVEIIKQNMPQKARISLTKNGEVFSSVTEENGIYQPVYALKGLAGAVYEIYAMDDVITPDGTVRAKAGDLVDTLTTGADGTVKSKPLYFGADGSTYKIVEVKAPYGMVLNPEPQFVTLTYAGQEIEISETPVSFTNIRQRISIDLKKSMEFDELFGYGNNGELEKVRFGLYASENIVAADGSMIPAGGLIEVISVKADGTAKFFTDLPVGTKAYVKEIATADHYILTDKQYPVSFDYAGQDTTIVEIVLNDGEDIVNIIKRGDIIGKKVDDDGFAVAGALFGLFRADETEFTEETAILTCESNPIGVFAFYDVPGGDWIIKELRPAPGFVANDELYPISITEDGSFIELEVVNRWITGIVKAVKTDSENGNLLPGARFAVYVDVDRNGEYNPDIDLYVNDLTETEPGVHILEGLRYGGYFLHEEESPENFLKDDEFYYFEITEDGATVQVSNNGEDTFINVPITGRLEITKKDISDGKLLPGVGFRVRNVDTGEVIEGYTDENGLATFTLRAGRYVYSEFAPLEGYVPDTKEYPFEITENGQIIKAEMTNERIPDPPVPDVPNTGDSFKYGAVIAAAGIAGAATLLTSRKRRKVQAEDEK